MKPASDNSSVKEDVMSDVLVQCYLEDAVKDITSIHFSLELLKANCFKWEDFEIEAQVAITSSFSKKIIDDITKVMKSHLASLRDKNNENT